MIIVVNINAASRTEIRFLRIFVSIPIKDGCRRKRKYLKPGLTETRRRKAENRDEAVSSGVPAKRPKRDVRRHLGEAPKVVFSFSSPLTETDGSRVVRGR